jgi:hypothetical protein
MNPYALMFGLCLTAHSVASEPLFTESEIYAPLVNAYQSELLNKYDALEKCVMPSCTFYTLLDIARLNSKLSEVKAILKEGK